MKKLNYISALFALPMLATLPSSALAQLVVSDTLTGATSSFGWKPLNGACLTAGDSTTRLGINSTLPACVGLAYYGNATQVGGVSGRLPDPAGKGALRLTNGDTASGDKAVNGNNNTGAVISTIPFLTNQGVQVTFTTATYGGNAYGNAAGEKSGADGLAFFLLDGTKTPSIGSYGGSLGYSCSQRNTPFQGANGGFLAVAMDEYGNFSNKLDSTSDGDGGPHPGTIAVRGAGSINYPTLTATYPGYYPAGISDEDKKEAVKNTCGTGLLQNWSGSSIRDKKGNWIFHKSPTTEAVLDYKLLTPPQLVKGKIYNQQAVAQPLRTEANLITYDLKITQDNLLSLSYSYNGGASVPVLKDQSITAGNGPLPPSFLFGFTAGTGDGSNVHEITCFKAAPINTASNSAGTNGQQSSQVKAGSQVYLSFYHPLNAWGQMLASDLLADAAGNVSIASVANWDANCTLTGGKCTATGTTTTAQASNNRSILTWDGVKGVPFLYTKLSTGDVGSLGPRTTGPNLLAYLRGDRTNEVNTSGSGLFRRRDGVLGDIVNSSPTWVGYPNLSYGNGTNDLLTGKKVAEFGQSYSTFTKNNMTRMNVVYTGANDGMLHGFRAGAFDASGNFTTKATPNDGKEVIAFMPQAVVNSIHSSATDLDFSSPRYAHNFYVDGTPATGDLYYNNAWHTWLVSGLGAGGNPGGAINDTTSTAKGDLFALDITDPSTFAESAAANLVIQEWNSNTLNCVNDVAGKPCGASLGNIYGTPLIRLMHDGNWAVIFGNGRNSATGTAGIYIMTVNRASGARTVRFLDTGAKSTTNRNGIDFVASADLDGDHVTDYLYAGDSAGNLWRFDVTSAAAKDWAADASPMFTTPGGQPISTQVIVSSIVQTRGPNRLVIGFGTGRRTPQTLDAAPVHASGTQSIYGVWDWNMKKWNGLSRTQYVSLDTAQAYSANDLQAQTITDVAGGSGSISGYRALTQNAVCWKGSNSCATANNKYGWKVNLPASSEQIIYNPTLEFGYLIVNTAIPTVSQALSCNAQPASGYTMVLSMAYGGAPSTPPFATVAKKDGITNRLIAGLGLSGTGTLRIVAANDKNNATARTSLVTNTVDGTGTVKEIDPPGYTTGRRVTWVKLR